MAVSGTQTFELTVAQVIRRACQLAGLTEASQTPDGDDYNLARDLLGMEMQALQAEGVLNATLSRASLAIVAGTGTYTLPSGTLDVFVGPDGLAGSYLQTGNTNETPVRAISRHEYVAQVPNKTVTGTPTTVYIQRSAVVTLQFWPVPLLDGTFGYSAERLVFDSNPGTATLDVIRKWQKALSYGVAWQVAVAKSAPAGTVKILKDTAEAEKATCRGQDVDKGPGQFYPAYAPTRY